MKKILCIVIGVFVSTAIFSQASTTDTVIVQLARTSQLVFTMEDKSDLEILQHYDFQALFEDMLTRLNDGNPISMTDSSTEDEEAEDEDEESEEEDEEFEEDEEDYDEEDEGDYDEDEEDDEEDEDEYDDEEDDEDDKNTERNERLKKFRHLINADFGLNNYRSGGFQPESPLYTVKPWGSWYVAINSVFRTRVNESFFVEWGGGFSWYNFKFQDAETLLTEDANSVVFTRDPRDFTFDKSKLTVSYINASVIPMFQFGDFLHRGDCWKSQRREFRIGAGMYAGYRIDSYTKQLFFTGEEERKEKHHDNFYLTNLRYGVRLQFGIHQTDFFVNYDLNELFAENRGPQLNAYSFGVIF